MLEGPLLQRKKRGESEVVSTAIQADTKLLVLLFRWKRMSTEMSLVWLTLSKALQKSIAMVNVHFGGEGWLKSHSILCARGRRDGSHVGWVKEEVKLGPDAEGVLGLQQQVRGVKQGTISHQVSSIMPREIGHHFSPSILHYANGNRAPFLTKYRAPFLTKYPPLCQWKQGSIPHQVQGTISYQVSSIMPG